MLSELRRQGSDTRAIEAKTASGGFPENTARTLSAFANTPGGGDLVFGVDEASGFAATGVYDVALCQQAVMNTARQALQPPISVTSEVGSYGGADVVVAHVPEAPRDLKPVRVVKDGKAYLRMYDGDYPLWAAEEQILVSQRGSPRDDEAEVAQADIGDLDTAALARYLANRRAVTRRFGAMADEEIMVRTGVLGRDGSRPTLAGLLALGVYPQQHYPSLAVQASLVDASEGIRALDAEYVTGSIPEMIDACMAWVKRVTRGAIVADPADGSVRDLPAYPPVAVRELVANALIHRDLSASSINQPVILRVRQGIGLLIANPGGLYGMSVEGLGKAPSSLRNARLTEILQFVRDERGDRVVERLGTGIPAAQHALRERGMEPLRFHDQAIRFTVFAEERAPGHSGWAGASLAAEQVLRLLARAPATTTELAAALGRSVPQVRYLLAGLAKADRVTRERLDGRTFRYRLSN